MHFYQASESAFTEIEARRDARKNLIPFGISFLDDALAGIMPHDLVLIGAPSAIGKTQLCVLIANAGLMSGKNVHYIALEAEPQEIERRIKYRIFADMFYHANQTGYVNSRDWRLGDYLKTHESIETEAAQFFEKGYKQLFMKYKPDVFGIEQLIEAVTTNADKTDLIIVDHVHYFDFEGDNENKSMKEIATTARKLALEMGKPIILIAHLRKRDRGNPDLCADMEEFHGSSDLFKIATKVITIAPGGVTEKGKCETYFRIPKNRMDGSVNRYIGRLFYDPRKETYEKQYRIGLASATKQDGFTELDHNRYPKWAKLPDGPMGNNNNNATEQQKPPETRGGTHPVAPSYTKSKWERPAKSRFPASDG
jgi:archaellum biogenesis ATPase FlaH